MTRLLLPLLLAVFVVSASTPAAAQPKPTVKSLTDAGLAAQKAGDHDKAIESFEQAYTLKATPILLFRIAESHKAAGRDDKALEAYQKFLATKPAGAEAKAAQESVTALEAKVAAAKAAEEARLAEEAKKAEEARLAEEAKKAADAKAAEEARLAEEAKKAEEAKQVEAARKAAEERAHASASTRRNGLIKAIAGGVFLAGGVAFGIHAKGLDTGPQRDREVAFLVIGGATGLILVGNGLHSYMGARDKHEAVVAVTPWATGESGGLAVSGLFR